MKKYSISFILTIAILFLLPACIFAKEYTIPAAYLPPIVDGKVTSEYEWYGAYHQFINYEQGFDWMGCVLGDGVEKEGYIQDKGNACKGYDIYTMWYNNPAEENILFDIQGGGLYFRIEAKDTSRGFPFTNGGGLNGGDCVQLLIDPFNYKNTTTKRALCFDFSYYTAPETKGPASNFEHWQYQSKMLDSFGVSSKSTITAEGYFLEIYLPWSALSINERLPIHRVGSKFGLGIMLLDSIQQSPFYLVLDFGGGTSPLSAIHIPRKYNAVTLGKIVYPPNVEIKETMEEKPKETDTTQKEEKIEPPTIQEQEEETPIPTPEKKQDQHVETEPDIPKTEQTHEIINEKSKDISWIPIAVIGTIILLALGTFIFFLARNKIKKRNK